MISYQCNCNVWECADNKCGCVLRGLHCTKNCRCVQTSCQNFVPSEQPEPQHHLVESSSGSSLQSKSEFTIDKPFQEIQIIQIKGPNRPHLCMFKQRNNEQKIQVCQLCKDQMEQECSQQTCSKECTQWKRKYLKKNPIQQLSSAAQTPISGRNSQMQSQQTDKDEDGSWRSFFSF